LSHIIVTLYRTKECGVRYIYIRRSNYFWLHLTFFTYVSEWY